MMVGFVSSLVVTRLLFALVAGDASLIRICEGRIRIPISLISAVQFDQGQFKESLRHLLIISIGRN